MPGSVVSRAALEHVEMMFAAINEQNLGERLRVKRNERDRRAVDPRSFAILTASSVGLAGTPGDGALLAATAVAAGSIYPPPMNLVRLQPVALQTSSDSGLMSLSALVPLILILMTITGAVYPAIDLTAGERERGTL